MTAPAHIEAAAFPAGLFSPVVHGHTASAALGTSLAIDSASGDQR